MGIADKIFFWDFCESWRLNHVQLYILIYALNIYVYFEEKSKLVRNIIVFMPIGMFMKESSRAAKIQSPTAASF